ncbi:MAG: TonB-dependent receptor [Bacteroidota bacterium]
MKFYIPFFLILFFGLNLLFSQEDKLESLDEIIIKTGRIDLPFDKNSRTIQIITPEEILNSTASSLDDLLQQVNGVDVRRRGVDGMQSDLYIRGGSFDQTLVLIDGFKTENPQTGHHTMNMMIPLGNIERVEIIKGPAARIFGQNAFTGAINIVTKNKVQNALTGKIAYGSFDQNIVELTGALNQKNSLHQVHYSRNASNGYRHNTDFKNQNIFVKSKLNTQKNPVDIIATFMERKFGANGFYASPDFKDQYEETQSSLIGVSTNHSKNNYVLSPKIYWKRGQDMYEFVRGKPEIYRNLHITNKVGVALDLSYDSKLGITGFGVDIAEVFITSNNLGDHSRFMFTGFIEHRFDLFNDKLDITPGIALSYYSDFKYNAFPGIDLGYQINNNFKLYGNIGYTYRIPTYTDLYYNSPTTVGNTNLKSESALTKELGIKFIDKKLSGELSFFYRSSDDLIDYVKEHETDKWQAENIQGLNTFGIESSVTYKLMFKNFFQNAKFGYSYLEDDILKSDYNFSRYVLNSIKHQVIAGIDTQFFKYLRQNFVYKFVERPDGENYNVFDARLTSNYKSFEFSAIFNNIFDEEYTETNLVPMPERNVLFSVKYTLK